MTLTTIRLEIIKKKEEKMKKVVLLSLAALSLTTGVANAATKLYVDSDGRVWTKPAEDRKELKSPTPWYSHADKLKFGVQAFVGYVYDDYKSGKTSTGHAYKSDISEMQIRRAYFQVKAYLLEDPKSYYRITFDVSKDAVGDEKVRAKYAYLYLHNVLPSTGVEIGLAHRPWHDYEEHNAWYYRSISEILIEDKKHGPDLSNSADFGAMFKTRTKYFEADYGLFNGEGYHSTSNGSGMSFEWRATAHILGVSGKDKQTKKTYWDASFFGQYNKGHKTVTVGNFTENQDLIFGGLHTVYNQPNFLIAAQYVKSLNTSNIVNNVSKQAGSGYEVNAEYRFGAEKEYRILGRYDVWTPDAIPTGQTSKKSDRGYIAGAAWHMNRNVEWVANVIVTDNEAGSLKEANNGTAYMVTAEINF